VEIMRLVTGTMRYMTLESKERGMKQDITTKTEGEGGKVERI
jgi:hypothetical protein